MEKVGVWCCLERVRSDDMGGAASERDAREVIMRVCR